MFILQSPGEIAFNIFNISVYWYGVIMAFAVFVGVLCANKLAKSTTLPANFFIDYSPAFIIVGLLGARLYYCILNWNYYFFKALEILDIRQGGLSIHGMIILSVLGIYILAKKKGLEFFKIADILACSAVLAQSIGRWGNFFNSEAFGLPTSGYLGLYIQPQYRPVEYFNENFFHPTFLYESLLNLLIFFVLLFVYKNKIGNVGSVFSLYLILYSIVRFFIEGLRIDSALSVFNFPIAQVVSVILFFVGICLLLFINRKSN